MSKEIVERVKAVLEDDGYNLSGPCGAYRITEAVAGYLPGYGVLSKPSGNNCEGNAVDQVMTRDGLIRDILGDAGGANTPQWGEPEQVDPARFVEVPVWRFPDTPPEPQEPPGEEISLEAIKLVIDEKLRPLEARLAGLETKPEPAFPRLRVRGSTNRTLAHGHKVDLEVVRESE